MSKEMVKKGSTDVALATLMAEDAGIGMEGADRDCFAVPFLRVLQQLSPQCNETAPEYIPGAKGGMLLNTVTNQVYDGKTGVIFIPCAFERIFIQWGPRGSESGGYKGAHRPEEVAAMRERGELTEHEGKLYLGEPNPKKSDQFSDTRNHFGLVIAPDGTITQVLLSLSSTQIKKSKQLLGLLSAVKVNGVTPPTWMSKIKITTVPESNDKGSWFGIKVEQAGLVDSGDLYAMGKAFNKIATSGSIKVEYAQEAEPAEKF